MDINEYRELRKNEILLRVNKGFINKSVADIFIKSLYHAETVDECNDLVAPLFISHNKSLFYSHNNLDQYSDRKLVNFFQKNDKSIIKNNGATKHILIKSDCYKALRILLFAFHQKIDIINIDPPHNKNSLSSYLQPTRDNYLSLLSSNAQLSSVLLKDTGTFFSTIDNENLAEMNIILKDIYGEDNFIDLLQRKTKSSTKNSSNGWNHQHDYIQVFCKDKSKVSFIGKEQTYERYSNPDNDPRGPWKRGEPTVPYDGHSKTNKRFPITNPYTGDVSYPNHGRQWIFTEKQFKKNIDDGVCVFIKDSIGENSNLRCFYMKQYQSEQEQYHNFNSISDIENINNLSDALVSYECTNSYATEKLKNDFDFGENITYEHPKSVLTNKLLLHACNNKNAVILDYFAGSGTLLQAVLELNREDGGHRQCILIDNNETTPNTPNGIVDDITIPRCYTMLTGRNVDGSISKSKWLETNEIFDDQLEIVDLVSLPANDPRIFDMDFDLECMGNKKFKSFEEKVACIYANFDNMNR